MKQESGDGKSMSPKPPADRPPSAAEKARKARLAEALRENLKRRKSQARERQDEAPPQGKRNE